MIRTKFKIIISFTLLLNTISWAQTATTINVGGAAEKYYPVTFTDPEWSTGRPTEIYISRPDVHMSGSWLGSTIAHFKYHTSNYGHLSNYIHAAIEKSPHNNLFFAGWADASTNNLSTQIIIWLKGGNVSYHLKSVSNVNFAVYDGVQNALPFMEVNGPARSFKTTIDGYVIEGTSSNSGSLVGGNGIFLANVGIGTAIPSERLSVNGKIRAHEIKVETANWPDYVFDDGYNLKSLEALEKYIKINKHLPEMPSATAVEANGVELGEMNKLLLKKVEELTLYLLQKDKELSETKKQMQEAKAQLNRKLEIQALRLLAIENIIKK